MISTRGKMYRLDASLSFPSTSARIYIILDSITFLIYVYVNIDNASLMHYENVEYNSCDEQREKNNKFHNLLENVFIP